MALPKLNDMPKYSVTIPSLNQEVRIRPFVVKEEKILLIAMESQDPQQIAGAIVDTIESCVEEPIDVNALSAYDVEYMFLQIRGISVGETSDLIIKCNQCSEDNEIKFNIKDIKIDRKEISNKIKLTDKITLEMKSPSYMRIAKNSIITNDKTSDVDKVFALIIESIAAVLTEEERINFYEISHDEATDFLESMTNEQFTKIKDYLESQPSLKHDIEYDCKTCGAHNIQRIEGMQAFF